MQRVRHGPVPTKIITRRTVLRFKNCVGCMDTTRRTPPARIVAPSGRRRPRNLRAAIGRDSPDLGPGPVPGGAGADPTPSRPDVWRRSRHHQGAQPRGVILSKMPKMPICGSGHLGHLRMRRAASTPLTPRCMHLVRPDRAAEGPARREPNGAVRHERAERSPRIGRGPDARHGARSVSIPPRRPAGTPARAVAVGEKCPNWRAISSPAGQVGRIAIDWRSRTWLVFPRSKG